MGCSEHEQMTAREEILSRIKSALKHEPARGDAVASNATEQSARPTGESREQKRGDLIAQFEIELTQVGGQFYLAESAEAACEYVRKLASVGVNTVVGWDSQIIREIGLAEMLGRSGVDFIPDAGKLSPAEFIQKATEAPIGVTAVDYALADTGTLVLMTGEGCARAASLLPPIHVAVVKSEQVISGLENLFASLRVEKGVSSQAISSAITFITGPSRTADIELTLVVGVHGPQQLHVILLSD
jgi:L-lactate dehydrogenase complex protein LldG